MNRVLNTKCQGIKFYRRQVLVGALPFPFFWRTANAEPATWPATVVQAPFHFYADFPLESYRVLLSRVSQLQRDLIDVLEVDMARDPIHVYLLQTKARYQHFMRDNFPNLPARRAMYIKVKGPGMVFAYLSEELAVDLLHESTHALLHAVLPMVPLWLDEGLAEYFEVSPKRAANDHPHYRLTRWAARFGRIPDLQRLESLNSLSQMGKKEYQAAWAWTHFFIHSSPRSNEIIKSYLATIQSHTPPGQLSSQLQLVPNWRQRFLEHFRG